MSAQVEAPTVTEYECGWCHLSADACLALRGDCCEDCTHYDQPVPDDDVDEVAVARAVAGDRTVTLNRREAAEAHARLVAQGLSAAQVAERLGTTQRTAVRWKNGHTSPITRRGRTMHDTIDELLDQAKRNPTGKIVTAAKRAEQAVQRVRDLLTEDAGKQEARDRIARLQRELDAAKAELRGKPAKPRATAVPSDGVYECRKGCGTTSPRAQGRAAHERFCTHESAVA